MKRLVVMTLLASLLLAACAPDVPNPRTDSEIQTLVARTITAGDHIARLTQAAPLAANSGSLACPQAPACPTCPPPPPTAIPPTCPAVAVTEVATAVPASPVPVTPEVALTAPVSVTQSISGTATVVPPASCVVQRQEPELAIVLQILDPITVKAILNGQIVTIRYLGLGAPLPSGNGLTIYNTGVQWNQQNVQGQILTLVRDLTDHDADGRLLRYAFVGDMFVNYELIQRQLAVPLPSTPEMTCDETFLRAAGMITIAEATAQPGLATQTVIPNSGQPFPTAVPPQQPAAPMVFPTALPAP
jgi:hypothetical protein